MSYYVYMKEMVSAHLTWFFGAGSNIKQVLL